MQVISSSEKIIKALKNLKDAALELANVLDEADYQLSDSAPHYLEDVDDFAFEMTTFVEDEIEELQPVQQAG